MLWKKLTAAVMRKRISNGYPATTHSDPVYCILVVRLAHSTDLRWICQQEKPEEVVGGRHFFLNVESFADRDSRENDCVACSYRFLKTADLLVTRAINGQKIKRSLGKAIIVIMVRPRELKYSAGPHVWSSEVPEIKSARGDMFYGLFLLYLFRFRNTNRSENTRSFWVNRNRNSSRCARSEKCV